MIFEIERAVTAGFLSFFTPCILPVLPFFLALLPALNQQNGANRSRWFLSFAAGFALLFLAIAVSGRFHALADILPTESPIAAAFLALFGIGLLALPRHVGPLFGRPLAALLIGISFGYGWSACVGPSLSRLMSRVARAGHLPDGLFLLAIYAAAMVTPFVLFGLIGQRIAGRWRKGALFIAGVALILLGWLIASRRIDFIAEWLLSLGDWRAVLR